MMSVIRIYSLSFVILYLLLAPEDACGDLTSTPTSNIAIVTVCPGVPISITCTHNNTASGVTRWRVTGTSTADCDETLGHGALMPPDDMCGLFTITMISGSSSPTMFTSTARTTATDALNGAVVECFSNGLGTILVGTITINVLAIPTPDLSVEQVSQSMVRANLSVTDTQCVARYQVIATPTSGIVSTSSSDDSTFNVADLNVCENSYTLSGSVITAGGVQSALSSPVNFTANLSDVINGITVTINTMDPLIEWTQTPNPLYPTCITGYTVTDLGNPSLTTTFDSNTTELTGQQLNAAGFSYCISIQPTVTPLTPMGLLTPAMGSSNLYTNLIDPDFPTTMLITYSFVLETDIVVLCVSVQTLSESVVPTRNYRYTNLIGSLSSMINFTGDMFEIALPGVDGGHVVNVTVVFERGPCASTAIASFTVPERIISNVMQGQPTDTSHTVTITLPLTPYEPEEVLIISTVEPSNGNPIMANFSSPGMQLSVTFDNLFADTSYTFKISIVLRANTTVEVVPATMGSFMTIMTPVPLIVIISSAGQTTSAYTITLKLPEIISTLTPADSALITNGYPLSSQYSVTFIGLSTGVEYSYSIRIVLRRNTSIDVSIPVTGSFTILTSFSTGAAVALTFALTFLVTLVLGVSIGVLSVLAVNKCRRSEKVTLQTEIEMRPPPVIYEDPDAVKPDPLTQGNTAYGEIVY